MAIAVAIGLMAFGMYLWQLSVPEFVQLYDTGVYLAASVHLVSAVVPYRDFTFVQPPGILLVMAPVAIFSRIFGTHDGFVLARVVSAATTALNASLLAMLVRHRGRVAMLVAGAGLALLPVAFFVSSGIKLDPYCICLVLIGSLFVFSRSNREGGLTNRDLVISGVLFGLAGLVKLWAVFPFVALVICLTPRYRQRVVCFVSGAGAAFVVISLPFLLSAPANFISQVFIEQLGRQAGPTDSASTVTRLIYMSGFDLTSVSPTSREVVIGFFVFAGVVAVAYWRRVGREEVDIYLLLAALIVVAGLLTAPESYNYYGYFSAPFLLGLLAVSLARLGAPARTLLVRIPLSKLTRQFVSWAGFASAIVCIGALMLYVTTFYTNYAWGFGYWAPNFDAITKLIPAGSCVVYDQVSYGVFANRLQSSDRDCPSVVDPDGMWMKWGYQLVAPAPVFTSEWKGYFERAQYVVLSHPNASGVPWSTSLTTWFHANYRLISSGPYVYVYQKTTSRR